METAHKGETRLLSQKFDEYEEALTEIKQSGACSNQSLNERITTLESRLLAGDEGHQPLKYPDTDS